MLSSTRSSRTLIFRQLFERDTSTFTYLLGDGITGNAILIDPVLEKVERDAMLVRELDLDLKFILNTHIHADHVTGSGMLKSKYFPNAKSVLGPGKTTGEERKKNGKRDHGLIIIIIRKRNRKSGYSIERF